MTLDEYRRANLANWEDRTPIHLASRDYDAAGFVADPSRISRVVAFDSARLAPQLGPEGVRGRWLLHLQCHFGLDTLSWARLGAEVTGRDFSAGALAAARRISAESDAPGRFVEAELHTAPAALPERFDIVYTGVGALNWLPDVAAWARVVADLLAPGGLFYIREGHPILWALDQERDDVSWLCATPTSRPSSHCAGTRPRRTPTVTSSSNTPRRTSGTTASPRPCRH